MAAETTPGESRARWDGAATAYGLTPTKPPVPARIVREAVPEPVEPEDGEILSPVDPPPASELLPTPPLSPFFSAPHEPLSPYDDAVRSRQSLWSNDPVRRLGASAVASASLSASGARTPLGGVPHIPGEGHVVPPAFGDGTPAFTPVFASDHTEEPAITEPTNHDAIRDAAAALGDQDAPAYEPTADGGGGDANATEASGGDEGTKAPPAAPADEEPPARNRGPLWLWILLAVIVVGVTGYVLAQTVFATPAPIIVPGVTVTEPAPAPTISPLAIASPTPFLAAIPSTVGTYALTATAPADNLDDATYGRFAEAHLLTYRSGDGEVTVLAIQYYNADDATAAWTTLAGPSPVSTPVMVGGVEAGQKASVTTPARGIVWRNGTAVFVLTGPSTELEAFYEKYGL